MNGFFAAIRRTGVTRSQDRWVGGVAGGLAARFGIDPLLARGVIGVSMLMGFGLALYGIAWALLPEQSDGRIHLEETIRGRFDIALLGAIALVVLGMSSGDWWFSWGPFGVEWIRGLAWVAVVVAGVVIVINALRSKDRPTSGPAAPTWQPPYPEGQRPMTSPSTPVPPAPAATGSPAAAPGAFDPSATSAAPWASAPAPTGPASTGPVSSGPASPRPPYGGYPGASVPPPPGRGWNPPPPTPPVPPVPPQPPKPPRRGPGAALTGVVVAVILIGLAALLAADRAGVYDGPIAAVVVGGGVLLVGLGIIVSGLRGRTAGGLTALAIVGMVVAGPAVVFQDGDRWDGERGPVRSIDVAPTSRTAAAAGYSFGVGDADIDLTGVPLTDDETLVVPISGGLGDVTVTVPEGAAVSAEVTSGAGNIEWRVDGDRQRSDGVGHDRRFTSEAMADGRDAQIALQIEVGVGSITIEED
jgi:phage shock protein PspC (stress-responsive transcriptional regulator)